MSSPFLSNTAIELSSPKTTVVVFVVLSVVVHVGVLLASPTMGVVAAKATVNSPTVLTIISTASAENAQASSVSEPNKSTQRKPTAADSQAQVNSTTPAISEAISSTSTSTSTVPSSVAKTPTPPIQNEPVAPAPVLNASAPLLPSQDTAKITTASSSEKTQPARSTASDTIEPPITAQAVASVSDQTQATSDASEPAAMSRLVEPLAPISKPKSTATLTTVFQPAKFKGVVPTIEKPKEAKRKRWQGTVVLRGFVMATGQIEQLSIFESSGYALLDETAFNAALHWQYLPANIDNEEIGQWVSIPVTFQ